MTRGQKKLYMRMPRTTVKFPEAWTIHVIRYLPFLGNYFTSLSSHCLLSHGAIR